MVAPDTRSDLSSAREGGYLQHLQQLQRRALLHLLSFLPDAGKAVLTEEVDLPDLAMDRDTTYWIEEAQTRPLREGETPQQLATSGWGTVRRIRLSEVAKLYPKIMLIGPVGSGKSTFVRQLAIDHILRQLGQVGGLLSSSEDALLPLLVCPADLMANGLRLKDITRESLVSYIVSLSGVQLSTKPPATKLLLILEDWDELAGQIGLSEAENLARELIEVCDRDNSHLIITGRDPFPSELPGLKTFSIALLLPDQADDLAHKWLTWLGTRGGLKPGQGEFVQDLLKWMVRRAPWHQWLRTPLRLSQTALLLLNGRIPLDLHSLQREMSEIQRTRDLPVEHPADLLPAAHDCTSNDLLDPLQIIHESLYMPSQLLLNPSMEIRSRTGNILPLINELVPQTLDSAQLDNGMVSKVLLAAQFLTIPPQNSSAYALQILGAVDRVRQFLVAGSTGSRISLAKRIECGNFLAVLRDPRFRGVLLLPDFAEVPGGEFLMGNTEGRVKKWNELRGGQFHNDELPLHRVELNPFYISKFSVVNAQYGLFVEETGRRPPDHWLGNFYPPEKANHPVVNVSWYDAMAYCEWLSRKIEQLQDPVWLAGLLGTGWKFRLPTEAEWEKAATGHQDKREWPWGDEWNSACCNSQHSAIGETVSVGLYPTGYSPYGIADLGGNVWEWCLDWYAANYYGKSQVKNPGGPRIGLARVVRGGSFISHQRCIRCTCRIRHGPVLRDPILGFRIVISPADI